MLLATLASLFFAWLAASAARDAVGEGRIARRDERIGARLQQLERVATLIGQVSDAYMRAFTGPMAGAVSITELDHSRGRLAAAIAATGLPLPHSDAVAQGSDNYRTALNEVRDRIADLEARLSPVGEPEPDTPPPPAPDV